MAALLAALTVLATGASFSSSTRSDGNSITAAPDWVAPWISPTDPGAYLRSTVALDAPATDTGSGVASVTIQRSPAGAGTWTDVCTDSSAPYSCSWDTTAVANGLYDLRATATDNASNSATSVVTGRRVDNTAPSMVSMTNPGTPLTGTRNFAGNAADSGGSGMASLAFQYRPSGGSTWTTACSDSASPYSCAFDTATLADGLYDVRSLASDNSGNTTASSTIANRRMDNTAPTGTFNDPGTYLTDTVSLTASAADGSGAGVTSVAFQRANAGSTFWTTICTDNTASYSCSFDTTDISDRQIDLRIVVTDGAGFTTTSPLFEDRWVDNTNPSSATMTNPGSPLSGTVTLAGTGADSGSGVASVTIQRVPANGFTYTDVCTDTTAPYECPLDTTALSDGLYDLRAVVTDYAGNVRNSARVSDRRIDNTAPAATMTDPGANLRGTVTLGATASDTGGSGVASVTIQRSPAGAGSWTDVCSDTTSAYTCSLDTTALGDGLYDFRAIALDEAGGTTTSALVTDRRVDNSAPVSVSMVDPGSPLAGNLALAGAAVDPGSGLASLTLQYKPSSGSTWVTACTAGSLPYTCSFDTSGISDGDYDFRSLATDAAGNTATSSAYTGRTVNNGGPAVTAIDPGSVQGLVTLSATASDGNGVDSVTIQGSPAGAGSWTDICTDDTAPYSCSYDTDALPEGEYDLRATAVDSLGSSSTSAVVGPRWVDRTAPAVTMTDPAAYMRAGVTLQSTASDSGSGIASVLYQRSPAGAGNWSTACTGLAAPFSCSLDTTSVADGSYDLRAIATDAAGNQTTSAVVAARTIDNTAPGASNIQAPNGGAVANRPDAGDTLVLTATETLSPQSIFSGWDGSAMTVSVRIVSNSDQDEVEVWSGGTESRLGRINLREDFVSATYMAFNSSTISQSGNVITITIGGTATPVGGSNWRSPPGSDSMQWTPSALATDLAGNPMSTTRITESGSNDPDF
jgi:Bacterial Ig domain